MAKKKCRSDIDIQKIYDEAPVVNGRKKLDSNNFYKGCTNLIKWLLIKSLIAKGHYKNNVRQTSYDEEDLNDCFTYILGKIHEKYDPSKGTLPTFIRNWVRGYGTIITQKQRRQYKYIKCILPLDLYLQNSISEEYRDTDSISQIEDYLDDTYFGVDTDLQFTKEDIEEHRSLLEDIYANTHYLSD